MRRMWSASTASTGNSAEPNHMSFLLCIFLSHRLLWYTRNLEELGPFMSCTNGNFVHERSGDLEIVLDPSGRQIFSLNWYSGAKQHSTKYNKSTRAL